MILISDHLPSLSASKQRIPIPVDRRKLAKRRWRGQAADGAEFGFDLPHPLAHGDPVHETESSVYLVEQQPENVLKIPYADAKSAALYGWMIGNMHFPADFQDGAVLAEDDPAVRQMLERNNIPYQEATAIFQPPATAAAHHH